ncbi:MAG: ribbon-helix-helix protein, CopG family [Candidatus Dormibacteraeota bacterium]|nr:ribbon-helix-helix protein, CopG family [Candidatus Dormibacteraeota bacterium]
MKRTTLLLPEDLAAAVEAERERLNTSTTAVIRKAIESYLNTERPVRLPFAALGRSGTKTTARDAERILAREWGSTPIGGRKRAPRRR